MNSLSDAKHSRTAGLLAEAAERAGKYEWVRAAELYQLVLDSPESQRGNSEVAKISELQAKSYFRAAFQSLTRLEFKATMHLAESAYANLKQFYEKLGSISAAKLAEARILSAKYWQIEDPSERKVLAERGSVLAEEAATVYERESDRRGIAEAYKEILVNLTELYRFAPDWKTLREIYQKVIKISQKAAKEFEELRDTESQLECLSMEGWFIEEVAGFALRASEISEIQKTEKQMVDQVRIAVASNGTPYATFLANEVFGYAETDMAKGLPFLEKALSAAEDTKDKLLAGRVLAVAGQKAMWASQRESETDKAKHFLERELEYGRKAISFLEVPFSGHLLDWATNDISEAHIRLGREVESDLSRKKEHLLEGIRWSDITMNYKKHVNWPSGSFSKGKASIFLAALLDEPLEKRRLLKDAISLAEETMREHARVLPHSWNAGVMYNYLALAKAELSKVEQDPPTKKRLLENAIRDMGKCIDLCTSWAIYPDFMIATARYQEWYGDILNELYKLSSTQDDGKRSVHAYETAISLITRSEFTGPVPQLRWKIAGIQNTMGEYRAAAGSFKQAGEDYRQGALKTPSLRQTFQEISSYMDGWASIDNARVHHEEEQYSLASECYHKAADSLQRAGPWSHLAKHYKACAFIEDGEASSRHEKPEAAIQSFTSAIEIFREAKKDLQSDHSEKRGTSEKIELEEWVRVTDGRIHYCEGRLEFEEAKLLDREGEKNASSVKFGSASQVFRDLTLRADSERTRREVDALAHFSEAWSKLKEAEEKSSSELFAQASDSFLQAHSVATGKFRPLALANSAICKAFQSGAMFRRTRDPQIYSGIKRDLETATDYYQEGGFQNAADWTLATQRLFDALLYLADAEAERDPKKKAELYHLAEKHLELARKLYDGAGFSSKSDEAQKHLTRARQEKEILLSPLEALTENPAMTSAITAPVSLIRDQAAGLEMYEAAKIVGSLTLHQKEIGVGSDLTMEVEIANIGKTAATLMKLEHLVPDGFEIDREKMPQHVEGNYLDMRGRRLEYLKTHEAKIPVKAKRKGTFQLQPRILFVDEKGKYRSYEFEPAAVTVKELGIGGWLKGPK
jgi:hypothetical protein